MNLEQIVRDCLEGKQGAWETLVNAYSKKVFNMAYQFCGSYQQAEDLTQEIFLKLYGALPKFDFSRNFTAWLLTLSKNHLIDEYRRTKWEKTRRDDYDERLLAASFPDNPEERLIREENRKLLWQGLNGLSSDMRMALILVDIQGKSYEESAEVMGLPLGTLKSRINRARVQLATLIREAKGGSS